ncbi:very short patch repair endonuclease [Streptomyces sp. JH010]|uniref:very short patch repair endonuclease n=1 Tax=Streptomyces TaxID=1883 RepID=UPI0023F82852|nr:MULTISPECIES: very short patch repair endonuclease [Streptomyces]MDF6062697.1 very short patch repair endonuclease [Streptomyces sp. JH010]WSI21876.1 very short patch repair endonuclease [[Kitasatospora] papulosa]
MSTAKPSSPGVSARMSRQARRDTAPEVAVRKLLHGAGYRYRINERVPGMSRRTIDIAFTRAKVAVMIDGCFWHGCPEHATQPKSNAEWWRQKLDRNMTRDTETTEYLASQGWTVLRFWEHTPAEEVAEAVRVAVDQAGREQPERPSRTEGAGEQPTIDQGGTVD